MKSSDVALVDSIRNLTMHNHHKAATWQSSGDFTFLNSLIDATDTCILAIDPQYQLVVVNQPARRDRWQSIGLNVEVGANLLDLLKQTNHTVTSSQQAWDAALQGKASETTYQQTNIHGDLRYYRSRYRPLYDARQQIIGAMQLIEDITEQKAAQEQQSKLREVQAFQQLANHMPQLVWSTNVVGQTNFTNSRFALYTGRSEMKLTTKDWQQLIHPDDFSQALKTWHYSLQTGEPCEFECRLLRVSDQMYRWQLVQSVPLKHKDGSVIRWISMATDIHERKLQTERITQTNRHLKHINRYLDDFVHATAHDLRAPVANLQLFMRTFTQLSSQEKDELIPKIARNINKLDNTLKGLVQLIDLQSQPAPEKERVKVVDILTEALTQYNSLIQKAKAKVKVLDPDHSSIRYIKPYLRSIVNNLLSNAVKYRDPHRPLQIKIMVQKLVNYCVLTFEDNGRGIDLPRYGNRLFQPFRRLNDDEEGLGIGLHLIRTMVEKNGGKVEVISQPEVGTAFKVYLREYA